MAKIVDKAIWNVGPLFIAIAVILIDMCVASYYLVVFPYNHASSLEGGFLGIVGLVMTFLFTVYMVYCIHFHYYMAIMTPPGGTSEFKQRNTDTSEMDDASLRQMLLDMEEYDEYPKTCKKCTYPENKKKELNAI
ncbi:hypothetical protein DFQ30_005195 [Apophysomyces sp. BC1015]|nr:hypothetical protein DFQ30_005195 [Apophysomyces sp. BC1015]